MSKVTFNDIKSANEQIKTTNIKGKEYAEVNQRIKAFRMVYPQGGIVTHMLSNEAENGKNHVCIIRAIITDEEGKELGTGIAYENENNSYINKTSYIENCETSAVGRALGMAGFGIDTSVCSAEELRNALLNQGDGAENPSEDKKQSDKKQPASKQAGPKPEPKQESRKLTNREKVILLARERGMDLDRLAKNYKLSGSTTEEQYAEVLRHMEGE